MCKREEKQCRLETGEEGGSGIDGRKHQRSKRNDTPRRPSFPPTHTVADPCRMKNISQLSLQCNEPQRSDTLKVIIPSSDIKGKSETPSYILLPLSIPVADELEMQNMPSSPQDEDEEPQACKSVSSTRARYNFRLISLKCPWP